MNKEFLERLKSPVLWGAVLTVIYAQLELLQENGASAKNIIIAVLIVLCAVFSALNNPTDRNNM